MDPVCLIVAAVVRATLPATEFTLAWRHSVQKTRWEEHYRVAGERLILADARIESTGAGMEPPPDAVQRYGWWTWHPQREVPEITLVRFSTANDYTLCWRDRCSDLTALVGPAADAAAIVIRPCAAAAKP